MDALGMFLNQAPHTASFHAKKPSDGITNFEGVLKKLKSKRGLKLSIDLSHLRL